MYDLLKKYGITIDQYMEIYREQKGLCKICFTPHPPFGRDGLHVDHCHKKYKVRGLLCNNCNRGIGLFSEDAANLMRASEYVAGFIDG